MPAAPLVGLCSNLADRAAKVARGVDDSARRSRCALLLADGSCQNTAMNQAAGPYAAPSRDFGPTDAPAGRIAPVLASRRARFGARFVDSLLFYSPGFAIVVLVALRKEWSGEQLAWLVIGLETPVFILQSVLISVRGQSVGKLLAKTRVERLDGRLPGFVRGVLVRDLLMLCVVAIPGIGYVIGLANALFVLRADRRCLHDLVADTRVVQLPPGGSLDAGSASCA